jgi:uncharacterized protein (TIGR02246 family)
VKGEFTVIAQSQANPDTQSRNLDNAVDQVRARHIAAVRAGDIAGAASLFSPDAVFLPPGQPAFLGADAIRGWFGFVLTGFRLEGFDVLPDAVERNGDLSIEHGRWNGTFVPKDGSPSRAGRGTYLTVYRHYADGSALIIRDTFNDTPAHS